MKTRKEYNNRWNAPLVNQPITLGEHDAQRAAHDQELIGEFHKMLDHQETQQAHFAKVVENSRGVRALND